MCTVHTEDVLNLPFPSPSCHARALNRKITLTFKIAQLKAFFENIKSCDKYRMTPSPVVKVEDDISPVNVGGKHVHRLEHRRLHDPVLRQRENYIDKYCTFI